MKNLEIIKNYQNRLWDVKDLSAIDQYFDKNVIINSPLEATKGIEKLKAVIAQWYKAFPQLKVMQDDYICDGDKVVSRWHAEGLHEGEFLGNEPTNAHVRYSGVTIYQLSNHKVVEYWAFVDMHGLLNSINLSR